MLQRWFARKLHKCCLDYEMWSFFLLRLSKWAFWESRAQTYAFLTGPTTACMQRLLMRKALIASALVWAFFFFFSFCHSFIPMPDPAKKQAFLIWLDEYKMQISGRGRQSRDKIKWILTPFITSSRERKRKVTIKWALEQWPGLPLRNN